MLAKADKPDDTRDQLSVGSWDVFGLPSHNFNCRWKNNKTTVTIGRWMSPNMKGGRTEGTKDGQTKEENGRWDGPIQIEGCKEEGIRRIKEKKESTLPQISVRCQESPYQPDL